MQSLKPLYITTIQRVLLRFPLACALGFPYQPKQRVTWPQKMASDLLPSAKKKATTKSSRVGAAALFVCQIDATNKHLAVRCTTLGHFMTCGTCETCATHGPCALGEALLISFIGVAGLGDASGVHSGQYQRP